MQAADSGHRILMSVRDSMGVLHLILQLGYASDAGFEGRLDLISSALRYLGPDTDQLRLTVSFETESRLHVKITDWMGKRWQVPESLLPRYESIE